jgi:hypothetical protein
VVVTALVLAAIAALSAVYLRDVRRRRLERRGAYDDVLSLFDQYRVTQEGLHYPALEGRYRGLPVKLDLVLDDMTWRKLPSLWLKATLLVPNATRGTLDFLVRPQGNEFYSPSADLPRHLRVPAEWPQHAILCSEAGATPDLAQITPHMSVFDDVRTKELLVTPLGLRLVYQAAQAERAEYLVLRQAKFAAIGVDARLVSNLLDRLIALAADLDRDSDALTEAA